MSEHEEQRIVRWCRQHDWGRSAFAMDGTIHGLIDESVDSQGKVLTGIVALPADMPTIQRWAGY